MTGWRSALRADELQERAQLMRERLHRVVDLEARVRDHSNGRAERFRSRGQWLPRERLGALLDPGAPFLELSKLAGYRMHDDDGDRSIAGGGVITGVGFVAGRRVVVTCSDSAIKGGAVSPMGLVKSLRAQQIASENRLPMVNLVESAGANLMHQAELFVDGGRIFANMARLSAAGLPQFTVVHGSSTAGGAYIPGLSDVVVVVRGRTRIFLAGPPLVKAALGEEADEEALGGADMHASVAGTAEYVAENDRQAIEKLRDLIEAMLGDEWSPSVPSAAEPPRYDPEELLGVVPTDPKAPYDCREVIGRLVDGSRFEEFKADYGSQTVCVHASLDGNRCGILANDGPIVPDGAAKAGQFIQLCGQLGSPIIYLQNTTGYMVGTEAERGGIVKHGSKMIQAVANAKVPQLTVLIGGSYGAGNYGMCGRAFDPRFIFSWPNARTSVMGPDQAARVMEIITAEKFAKRSETVDPEHLRVLGQSVREKLGAESDALFATARLWDDGIIDPRDTRAVLAFALATCREGDARTLRSTSYGVARL